MTQLDRLEALAEEWGKSRCWPVPTAITTVHDALPDLIRVVRAAKTVRVEREPVFGHITLIGLDDLQAALAPLFSEVES